MKKVWWSEQEKMKFRSSQHVWRVDRQKLNSHSSYLSIWLCTAPLALQFGYVVVHKLRHNFDEESMVIWARENEVLKLTTCLTGWQANDEQSLIVPEFLELYCSDGSQIWVCCSSGVKEQLSWRQLCNLSYKKWCYIDELPLPLLRLPPC